jgi:hypothetical protein
MSDEEPKQKEWSRWQRLEVSAIVALIGLLDWWSKSLTDRRKKDK